MVLNLYIILSFFRSGSLIFQITANSQYGNTATAETKALVANAMYEALKDDGLGSDLPLIGNPWGIYADEVQDKQINRCMSLIHSILKKY